MDSGHCATDLSMVFGDSTDQALVLSYATSWATDSTTAMAVVQAKNTNMASDGGPGCSHQHGPWWQNSPRILTQTWDVVGSQTQTWPPVAAWTWRSPWPQVAMQATQIYMAPGCSSAYGHQRDFRLQHGPQISVWPSVVSRATGINTDPSCSLISDPDMALGGSMDSDIPMASGGSAGHIHQHVPWL